MNSQGTLILTRNQVAELMRFDDYFSAVEQAFRSYALGQTQLAGVVDIDATDGAFHIKAASMETKQKYVAVKVNGNFPQNATRFGLPTIQGAILLYDGTSGFPLALMDSIEITIQRTGAATILGAKHLARSDSTTVLICGCGNQGGISLGGLRSILPIEHAFVFDTNGEASKRFAEQMSLTLAIPVTPVASLREAARTSDVIVTCTPARSPFLDVDDVSPGTFIAAVGADSHDKQELDSRLLASHKIVVDILEQCATIGELHHALKAGLMKKSDVYAELGEVVSGSKAGRTSADEIIILDTTGAAIQDVAAAAVAYERARERGVGTFTRFA
jgi:ornithine cyclodeaminase/alanine dehydrogenase